ncbi:MAG: hypothetical protein IKG11_08100 [Atopobiaceae bacterium]|nr:hypothetical protein [Atopobiaceae bacterium]MDO4404707.1 hypothetical protein [Atopobiaceae bacterium]
MKRIATTMTAALMAFSLVACGAAGTQQTSESAEQTSTSTEATSESTEVANPWKEATNAQEAGESAGVGYFIVPADNTQSSIGPINWYGYKYMTNLAEADGAIGAAELTVRKGLKQDSTDVSGDYNKYTYEWTQQVGDWQVSCYGNEENKMMKAIWLSDNFSYSIEVRGQGDLYNTFGLGADDTALLVSGIE